jgi:hypothetical protein
MSHVESYILGQREQKPTPNEIGQWMSALTRRKILALSTALENELISPNTVLVSTVDFFHETKERKGPNPYFLSAALALRYGANENLYVNVPSVGTVHILAFLHIRSETTNEGEERAKLDTQDKQFRQESLAFLTALLVASGSKASRPVFQPTSTDRKFEATTTLEWIRSQGFNSVLYNLSQNLSELRDTYRTKIATYLNKPSKADVNLIDPVLAIRTYASDVFAAYLSNLLSGRNSGATTELEKLASTAISVFATDVFSKMLTSGYVPTYVQMNSLLLSLSSKGENFSTPLAKKMLLDAVQHGAYLDTKQFSLAKIAGEETAKEVQKEYNEPYWKKACRSTKGLQETDPQLQELAYFLHLDPEHNKKTICKQLEDISSADPNALVQAVEKRMRQYITDLTGYPYEFVNNDPEISCQNGDENIYQYNPLDVAVYRDEKGKVWCFTKDLFDNLLKTETNPYTKAPLPKAFLAKLSMKRQVLIDLGVKKLKLRTFSESLQKLSSKQEINDKRSEKVLSEFFQEAEAKGFTQRAIEKLKPKDMQILLSRIGIEADLESLPDEHALYTLAHAATRAFRETPGTARNFFSNLEVQQS